MSWYVTSTFERLNEHSGNIALLHKGNPVSYDDLRDNTYRVARALRRAGLGHGDGIVVVAGNTPAAVVVRLAAYLLGLRVTPLTPEAVENPLAAKHILADVDATALVCEAALPATAGIRVILELDELLTTAQQESADPMPTAATEDDVCRVQYTSGTTGQPKGVPTTCRGLGDATRAWEASGALPPGMRLVLASPLAAGSGDIALNLLRAGGTVELLDGFDPAGFAEAVRRAPLAMTYLYPSWIYRLLDHLEAAGEHLESLKFLVYGSAPILPERLRQAVAEFGPMMLQTYASTEVPAIAALGPEDHALGVTSRPELLASVGRPLPGVTVEVRGGEIGEIWVRSAAAMPGYWRRPDLTADVIDDGFVRTGDLGRLTADGYLHLVGRVKDMVIVDGVNHYAAPIEDCLATHPAVADAAVVGAPDQRTGEAIHAFVVLRREVTADELRALVHTQVARGPQLATVTVLPELPLTAAGKVDKKALAYRLRSA
ncbi:class I adenylate-forming enzyme family protein [Kutzneria sp. CA-103260]|uniref:class I adenylate-forming enzyme family protein n=1 Tax=Kutzneria sp. CA-103260 TaxID=2802641 RepID=UPI001BAC9B6D|nr:AMP-binding protein [Kutzneria sp. CA-103260]QUQ62303.1 fatty acid CoA ligase [Kutzneria sp. CA-103260]